MPIVKITKIEDPTELYCKYPGQTGPQPCFIELDPSTGALTAKYNPEVGNAVPASVYHGKVLRWSIPLMNAETVNALMEQVTPLAQRVCDGYSERWNGSNTVGKLTEDAEEASDKIDTICDREEDSLHVWEASEWYGSHSDAKLAADLGITSATTDEELAVIVSGEETMAVTDGGTECDKVEGIGEYLTRIRDALVKEAT